MAGRWYLLAVIAVAIVTFAPTFTSPFLLDDFLHLERSQDLSWAALMQASTLRAQDLEAFWWVPPHVAAWYFRPLITLSFALDQRLWGANPRGYHLANLLAHGLAAWLVYRIGRRLPGMGNAAPAAGMLFLLHPVHVGAVHWISGRTDVYMTVFYLLALSSYLDLRLSSSRGCGRIVLAPLAFVGAVLAKESAITLPASIVCLEWLVLRRSPATGRIQPRAWVALIATAVVAGLYACLRLPMLLASTLPPPYLIPLGIATLPDLLLQWLLYVLSCVFLLPVLPFHNLEAWKQHPALIVLLGTILVIVGTIAWRRSTHRQMLIFGAAWFALTLLPSGGIMMGQRLVYLPSVGFCLLLAAVLCNSGPTTSQTISPTLRRGSRIATRGVVLAALLGVYALAALAQAGILRALSQESARQTRAIAELSRRDPPPHRILVANGWTLNSLWISQATRWISRGDAPPVTVLTLSPALLPPTFADRHPLSARLIAWLPRRASAAVAPAMVPVDSTTVIVRAADAAGTGLFDSSFLQFFMFGRHAFQEGEIVRTGVLTAEVHLTDEQESRAIRISLPQPLSDPRTVWVLQDSLRIREIDPTRPYPGQPAPDIFQ